MRTESELNEAILNGEISWNNVREAQMHARAWSELASNMAKHLYKEDARKPKTELCGYCGTHHSIEGHCTSCGAATIPLKLAL